MQTALLRSVVSDIDDQHGLEVQFEATSKLEQLQANLLQLGTVTIATPPGAGQEDDGKVVKGEPNYPVKVDPYGYPPARTLK